MKNIIFLSTIFLLFFLVEPIFAQESPITEFDIPTNGTFINPFAITAHNKDIWFTQRLNPSIVHFDTETSNFTTYHIYPPEERYFYQETLQMWGITVGPDGMIWFTDATENKIRTLDPETGEFNEFLQLEDDSLPWDLKFDNEGTLWFTEFGRSFLTSVQINDVNSLTEYRIPSNISSPSYFEFDKDGNIWLVESGPGILTKFDTYTHEFTQFILPSDGVGSETVNPIGLAIDNDGNIWYSQFRTSLIGKLNPNTNEITEYATGTLTSGTYQIISDNAGNIWTTQFRADRLIKISPQTNSISEFKIPTDNTFTQTLTSDSNGNIWFVERNENKIGFFNSQIPEPTNIIFDSNKIVVSRPQSTTTQFNLSSEIDVFFLARGNERVTGILDGITVEFTPSHSDPSAKTIVSYSVQAARNLPTGITHLTIGAATMDLSYYTGSFVEVEISTGLTDPIFLIGTSLCVLSAIIMLRKSGF